MYREPDNFVMLPGTLDAYPIEVQYPPAPPQTLFQCPPLQSWESCLAPLARNNCIDAVTAAVNVPPTWGLMWCYKGLFWTVQKCYMFLSIESKGRCEETLHTTQIYNNRNNCGYVYGGIMFSSLSNVNWMVLKAGSQWKKVYMETEYLVKLFFLEVDQ